MNPASAIAAGGLAAPVGDTALASPLTRKVRLIKTHIHAGLPCKPGDQFELLHELADWLVAEGAAEFVHATDAPAVSLHASHNKPNKPSIKKDTP